MKHSPSGHPPSVRPGRRRIKDKAKRLPLVVQPQPDGVTCGPTCLHAVYQYYNDHVPLEDVIAGVEPVAGGGTLAVNLACHALQRGYKALIYTYDLNTVDPSWFADPSVIPSKLLEQMRVKSDARLQLATRSYLRFFELGGTLKLEELTAALLRHHLSRGQPILTGLSATYLYECAREYRDEYDDVRGEATGHFVVLSGYDNRQRQVLVSDPLHDNPRYDANPYRVSVPRLISAILLGILTYDANLLVLTPQT